MLKAFIREEEELMNKRYFIYSLLIIAVISTFIIVKFGFQDKGEDVPAAVAQKTDDIRHYYYRSIPGLMRAEQAGLIKPIHKTFNVPDTEFSLKIDRIWYNNKNTYIFYHVENIDKVAYLGGFFSSHDNNPIAEIHPRDFIGTPTEKGVFSNSNFYSFLKATSVENMDKDIDEHLLFSPSLFIEDSKYSFKAVDINLELDHFEEPVETFELDSQIDIGEDSINLYRLEAGISYNKIYFAYTGINSETIYELKAHLTADTGESFDIVSNPISINREEGKYYIEMQPFNELPESIRIQLESISVIGEESIHGAIDTQIVKKKGIQTLSTPLARVMDTDIILGNLHFKDNEVEIELLYDNPKDRDSELLFEVGHLFCNDQEKLLCNINNDELIIPNIISIKNNFGESVEDISHLKLGISYDKDHRVYCRLPLDFWENSNKIFISIENLTYRMSVNQSIEVVLMST